MAGSLAQPITNLQHYKRIQYDNYILKINTL